MTTNVQRRNKAKQATQKVAKPAVPLAESNNKEDNEVEPNLASFQKSSSPERRTSTEGSSEGGFLASSPSANTRQQRKPNQLPPSAGSIRRSSPHRAAFTRDNEKGKVPVSLTSGEVAVSCEFFISCSKRAANGFSNSLRMFCWTFSLR